MAGERTGGSSGRAARRGKQSFSLAPPNVDFFWLGLYLALLLGCAAVMVFWEEHRGAGLIGLVITIALMPVGLRASSQADSAGSSSDFERLSSAIETMTQEAGLSDAAKRVLHRRQEREILRREIERDINDGDWDAAMVLVKELAERFGYRADAEEFRARIDIARAETLDRNVATAISHVEDLIRARRWTDAYAEAARVARLYPDSPRVGGLRHRVDDGRGRYKIDLERRFLIAAERDEIDHAMEMLKELDNYLSEDEAGPFREVARGVIGKARDNLGVRFKLAIQDRNWPAAVEFGEKIIADFPNTRMAGEVRTVLDSLRTRADGVGAAPAGA